ncbi:MAG: 50S ribosomal protein L15 [Dehalococcoidia bacterium]|jgi:large subunit ribosomal protein L15|nr:MAG: large subunit ribosomal protein L15 [Chloroflexota bacterium]
MIKQHDFQLSEARKNRKRVGRGKSSGQGTYAGRGLKGQKARGNVKLGFEGGQLALIKRHGHRKGFRPFNRVDYQAVNLGRIDKIFNNDDVVNADSLYKNGLISSPKVTYKVLSNGILSKSLNITANRFSSSAKKNIEDNGGTFEELDPYTHKIRNRKHRRSPKLSIESNQDAKISSNEKAK